eukprot:COSAG06_NODE_16898_length_974_cov_1.925714_2_plen_46_part_01
MRRKRATNDKQDVEEQNEAFTKAINSLRDLLRYTMVLKTKTYVKGV